MTLTKRSVQTQKRNKSLLKKTAATNGSPLYNTATGDNQNPYHVPPIYESPYVEPNGEPIYAKANNTSNNTSSVEHIYASINEIPIYDKANNNGYSEILPSSLNNQLQKPKQHKCDISSDENNKLFLQKLNEFISYLKKNKKFLDLIKNLPEYIYTSLHRFFLIDKCYYELHNLRPDNSINFKYALSTRLLNKDDFKYQEYINLFINDDNSINEANLIFFIKSLFSRVALKKKIIAENPNINEFIDILINDFNKLNIEQTSKPIYNKLVNYNLILLNLFKNDEIIHEFQYFLFKDHIAKEKTKQNKTKLHGGRRLGNTKKNYLKKVYLKFLYYNKI